MMKKYIVAIALFIGFLSIIAQQTNPYLISNNGVYRYNVGIQNPDTSWKKINYNDSAWIIGKKSIGFGDGDDTTLIPNCKSVYLRSKFTVGNPVAIRSAHLMVDFDDAFVAYLNGVEIARVNMGKYNESTTYNQLSDRSHEANGYRYVNNPVAGYFIDNSRLSKILINGTNVLAIEVHNDSINGSDMSFNCNLFDLTNQYYNIWSPQCRFMKQVKLDSSDLPIVVINTNEYAFLTHHLEYFVRMGIVDNKNAYNKPGDVFNHYNGYARIEIRGESSNGFTKKSYNIETEYENGDNRNVALLGMPSDNDWILQGPFADKSLMRNEIVYELGRKTGHYAPRTRYCELMLNGEYMGLYMFIEKIKRDSARVDIANLKVTDTAGISLTGGYLVKYDKGSTALQFVEPNDREVTPQQKQYLLNYLDQFYSVLDRSLMFDPFKGYKHYIDEKSLVDYIVVNELTRNCDAYLYSTYMYKDKDSKDGRLKYGPLWDYDLGFGNATFQNGHLTAGWQFDQSTNNKLNITKIMRDTAFVKLLANRWIVLRKGVLNTDSLNLLIDRTKGKISISQKRNHDIWQIIDKDIFSPYFKYYSYDAEIAGMKDWINKRATWIDQNISKIYYPIPVKWLSISESLISLNVYPNPFVQSINIEMNTGHITFYTIELVDICGKTVFISSSKAFSAGKNKITIDDKLIASLVKGIYILTVKENGKVIAQRRMVK